MKVRKLLAVGLGISMMFAAPAYANDADAVAFYQEIEAKNKTLSDMNAYYDYQIQYEGAGVSMDMRLEMNAKMNQMQDPEHMKMYTYSRMTLGEMKASGNGPGEQQSIDMSGTPITFSTYYADGMYYMDMLGQKVKQPMPLDEIMKQTQNMTGLDELSLDSMQNMKLRTEGENRVLSYTMDVNILNGILEQFMGSMTGLPQMQGAEDVHTRYKNLSGETVVNPEGYCVKTRMHVDMEVEVDGETVTMTMEGDVGIADPGKPVELPAINPAEYQQLQDVQ